MARPARSEKMSLRLTEEEVTARDALANLYGTDGSTVIRMALRRLAIHEGMLPKRKVPQPEKGSGAQQ